MRKEMEIMIRELRKGQKDQKALVITRLYPMSDECTCPWKIVKVSARPPWLKNPICSECGNSAEPSKYFQGGVATLVEIDDNEPRIFCDKCREDLFHYRGKWKNKCKHVQMEQEIKPVNEKNIWHGRIEWTVTGERWYRVKKENIKPYVNFAIDRTELMKKFREFMNLLYSGKTIKTKARYDKINKILEVNVANFN